MEWVWIHMWTAHHIMPQCRSFALIYDRTDDPLGSTGRQPASLQNAMPGYSRVDLVVHLLRRWPISIYFILYTGKKQWEGYVALLFHLGFDLLSDTEVTPPGSHQPSQHAFHAHFFVSDAAGTFHMELTWRTRNAILTLFKHHKFGIPGPCSILGVYSHG